jgi:hypothetical protein
MLRPVAGPVGSVTSPEANLDLTRTDDFAFVCHVALLRFSVSALRLQRRGEWLQRLKGG